MTGPERLAALKAQVARIERIVAAYEAGEKLEVIAVLDGTSDRNIVAYIRRYGVCNRGHGRSKVRARSARTAAHQARVSGLGTLEPVGGHLPEPPR